jgi:hypothetical protein
VNYRSSLFAVRFSLEDLQARIQTESGSNKMLAARNWDADL